MFLECRGRTGLSHMKKSIIVSSLISFFFPFFFFSLLCACPGLEYLFWLQDSEFRDSMEKMFSVLSFS